MNVVSFYRFLDLAEPDAFAAALAVPALIVQS